MGSKVKHRQFSDKYGEKRLPRNLEVQRLHLENKGGFHADSRERRRDQKERQFEESADDFDY